MQAPGKTLLKVVSILFIVFGAIATILSVIGIAGAAMLAGMAGELGGAAVGGILVVAMIVMAVVSVLELVLGIMGVSRSGKAEQAKFFINTGIVLCVLAAVSMIMSIAGGNFQITSLIGFVLPVLYIVGGTQNKKAMENPAV